MATLAPPGSSNYRYTSFALAALGKQQQLLTQLNIYPDNVNIDAAMQGAIFDAHTKLYETVESYYVEFPADLLSQVKHPTAGATLQIPLYYAHF